MIKIRCTDPVKIVEGFINETSKEKHIMRASKSSIQVSMQTIENTSLEMLKLQNELALERLKVEKK